MKTQRRYTLGRPADRTAKIVSGLRSEIVAGILSPGMRLPTRVDVERRYEASPVTVQRALTQLANEGFVRVDRTLATYVADSPPHLSRYAIVFPNSPQVGGQWNLWFASLLRASTIVAEHRGITIEPFFDVDMHTDAASYIHLVDNLQSSRVAGIIFSVSPYRLQGTPVIDYPGVPRVVAMDSELLSCMRREGEAIDIAMRMFAESGRRRVAVFANTSKDIRDYVRVILSHGLETRSYWILPIDLASPQAAMNVVSLLMSPENSVHPDAIYIDDDNLTDPVFAGLLGAGIRVPAELDLIANTNLPVASKSLVPIRRFGVDARMVVSRCVDLLDRQRAGSTECLTANIPYMIEDELTSDRDVSISR